MSEPRVTILHIDDNEANRYVVTRVLQRAGFTVVEAATGSAGLEATVEHQPALVILDVKLPDLSGFEVCRQIKSNPETAFVPVLHLSASFVQSQDKAEGLDSGADAYLAQPVEPIELIATVRSLLRIRSAEAAALSSSREWQITFDSINDGVCLVDQDGKILRCNRAISLFFGKPLTQILGRVHHELMLTSLGAGDGTCFRLAKATHKRQVLELHARDRWFTKTMDPVFDGHGTFTGAVFILSDITDRKRADVALRESEELKHRVLESSYDCIKVLTLEGRLLYLNKGGMLLLEIDDLEPLLNTDWTSFWQDGGQEKAREAIATANADRVGQFQGYCPTTKGTPKWWDVLVTPVRNAAGEIAQLLVVSRDITKQKQAETEREQLLLSEQAAREQAQQANQIKDEFLAVLSHELRSPLNPILGWARILRTSQQDEAKTQYALETIERNAKLQVQLIEDLLDVSRILRGKVSLTIGPVGLAYTIRAALETVRLAAEAKAIQIKTILNPNVGQVLGDSSRLQQIVWNLLANAVKFTPSAGTIEIRLEQVGSNAQIQVKDTGKGIASDFLPYVFDYFRQEDGTTTRKFGGLGLGLAIVHHLTELHGGTVTAESPGEGLGATFTISLPMISVPSSIQTDASSPKCSEFDFNNLQILFVDDDRDSRELITFLLQQHGAKVTEVESAGAALTRLKQTPFDLLISDIGMPSTDGYALIRQVRTQPPDQGGEIPAIALTAYAGEIDQQQALAAGFQHHLTKPIEPELLMETIWALMQPKGEPRTALYS